MTRFYSVQVPAYRDKSYTYVCEEQLVPFTLVRVPRRQFGSCQTEGNDEWTHGTVVAQADEYTGREAYEMCVPLRALEDFSTAQLQVPTDGVARIVYWVEGCSYANVVLARAWLRQYTDDITVAYDLATEPEDHDHGWAIITDYHTEGWRKALASCEGVQFNGQPLTDYLSHVTA